MNIGGRIKKIREEKGLTQEEVARRAGVTAVSISRWENKEREPTFQNVERIAQALGVTMAEMVKEPQKPGAGFRKIIEGLKQNGSVFWLDRDPGETYYNLDISGRPLAQAGREDFLARYAVRSPIYHRWADFIIVKPESPQCAENRISIIYREVSES